MNKKALHYLLIIFLSLNYSQLYCQYLIEENEKGRILKNSVKEKKEYQYTYDNTGKLGSESLLTSLTSYDSRGNIIQKISYKLDGNVSSKLNYKYDSKGNKIEYTRFDGRKNAITLEQHIQYDYRNNKVEEWGKEGPESTYKNSYTYNAAGDVTEIKYTSDNLITEVRKITYSTGKRIINVYNGSNVLQKIITKTVDSKENILCEETKTPSGTTMQKIDYKYNTRNKLLEQDEYYSGQLRNKKFYFYDEFNNLVKIEFESPDGKRTINNLYTYDKSGNLLEEKWLNEANGKYSIKKYKYDSQGNLSEADCYYAQFDTHYLYKYQYTK
jgi:hypothetical protein